MEKKNFVNSLYLAILKIPFFQKKYSFSKICIHFLVVFFLALKNNHFFTFFWNRFWRRNVIFRVGSLGRLRKCVTKSKSLQVKYKDILRLGWIRSFSGCSKCHSKKRFLRSSATLMPMDFVVAAELFR